MSRYVARDRVVSRAVALLVLVLAPALLGSACSPGAQDSPHPVTLPAPISPTGAAPTTGYGTAVRIFLVHQGRLVPATRRLPEGSETDPAAALTALEAPVSEHERNTGLKNKVPASVTNWQVARSGSTLTLLLPAAIDRLDVTDQILALGQIVFTLTARPEVGGVAFVDGTDRPVAVPDGAGRLTTRPLARSDYAEISPSLPASR